MKTLKAKESERKRKHDSPAASARVANLLLCGRLFFCNQAPDCGYNPRLMNVIMSNRE